MSSIIQLGNAANTGTFSAVDTLTSGSGDDTIGLSGAVSNASIDLGAGNNTLTFGNFANSATVANTETITGGAGINFITGNTGADEFVLDQTRLRAVAQQHSVLSQLPPGHIGRGSVC